MFSGVPEALRDRGAITAAIAAKKETLIDREAARDAAIRAATEAREAALSAQKELQAAERALADREERYKKVLQAFETRLQEALLSKEEFDVLKPAIARIESDWEAVNEHRRKLGNAEEAARTTQTAIEGRDHPDLQAFDETAREAEEKLKDATNLRAEAATQLKHRRRLHDELATILSRLDEAETASGPLRNLAALFDAKNPMSLDLETFAIGAMFDQVLDAANQRLGPMSANRYTLERELEGSGRGRRGLGIQVFDVFTGKARSTSTLSGGESFIAALALALGLADVVESASGKVRLDTIFIDEGFGSLDTENGSGTLDQVLQALGSVVGQNRAVGLISHVPLVQEVIPNGFYVRKELAGSRVEARGVV